MILTDIAKNALLTGLKNALNKGGDNSNFATLNFYDSDGNVLAKNPIDNTDGVITANQLKYTPTGQASVLKSGTISTAKIYDDVNNLMIDDLNVGTSNADVIVDKVNLQMGGYVSLKSVTFKMP